MVGNGGSSSDRGAYNISMHQSFRWNSTDYYTVFDLPISVTNSIPADSARVDCALLENKVLSVAEVGKSSDSLPGQPWVQGVSTSITSGTPTGSGASATQSGMGSRSHSGAKLKFAVTALAVFGYMLA
jgi:hypothetical protein